MTNALTRVSGSKAEAARLLGIPRSTLESLIDIYELESMVAETLPLAAKIGRAEIKRALEASGGHITGAARALGISPPGLRGLIRQYGIENEVARAPETPLTPESIRQAASETDGTARAIASKLGSTSSAVRSAAARFGIELRHERQRKVFRVECDALKRAIEETDGTRAAVAQKLGISSRVTITEAAKRCGLEGLLKHPLRRVTRAEFEEALRSTDRTRRAVAEFLGINFGTVAKLAERFGLESKLVSGY